MTTLYKLKDYRETFKFEKEHPAQLRWDDKYKLYQLTQEEKFQGIWLRDKQELVGEILISWQSENVAHIDSFTVLPSHRGSGLGHELVKLSMEWAENYGFKYLTGEARKGPSWKIFENFAATPIVTYKNWNDTKEDYIFFKLEMYGNS